MFNFDPDTKELALVTLKNLFKSRKHPVGWEKYLNSHYDWLAKDTNIDPFNANNWSKGIKSIDADRGTDFDSTFPELANLKSKIELYLNCS